MYNEILIGYFIPLGIYLYFAFNWYRIIAHDFFYKPNYNMKENRFALV